MTLDERVSITEMTPEEARRLAGLDKRPIQRAEWERMYDGVLMGKAYKITFETDLDAVRAYDLANNWRRQNPEWKARVDLTRKANQLFVLPEMNPTGVGK